MSYGGGGSGEGSAQIRPAGNVGDLWLGEQEIRTSCE